jgi:uncharacterized membrane protein YbaN (DUF454 family)
MGLFLSSVAWRERETPAKYLKGRAISQEIKTPRLKIRWIFADQAIPFKNFPKIAALILSPLYEQSGDPGMSKVIWLLIGSTSLALGLIGIVVPLLPTTPFVLLTGFAFSKASHRLHRWLLEQKTFGPIIQSWEHDRSISLPTKWAATLMLPVMISYPLFFMEFALPLKAIVLGVAAAVLTFIWSCKTSEEYLELQDKRRRDRCEGSATL